MLQRSWTSSSCLLRVSTGHSALSGVCSSRPCRITACTLSLQAIPALMASCSPRSSAWSPVGSSDVSSSMSSQPELCRSGRPLHWAQRCGSSAGQLAPTRQATRRASSWPAGVAVGAIGIAQRAPDLSQALDAPGPRHGGCRLVFVPNRSFYQPNHRRRHVCAARRSRARLPRQDPPRRPQPGWLRRQVAGPVPAPDRFRAVVRHRIHRLSKHAYTSRSMNCGLLGRSIDRL